MKLFARTTMVLSLMLAPSSGLAEPATCTGSPAAMLDAAKSEMKRGLDQAITAIRNQDTKAVDMEVRWLGVRNSDQEKRVLNVLIAARGLSDSVSFVCDMLNDTNTFENIVASAEGGHVLLFTANYFSYPEVGVLSRPTILFHEMTHLPAVANTNANDKPKEIYDPPKMLKLAVEKPDDALRNAASYQYFLGEYLYGP